MSTRSIIAKPEGDTWRGVYVHSDGYPTGVGAALLASYHRDFKGDIDAMRAALIDAESVGWSNVLGRNLSLPGEWNEFTYFSDPAEALTHGPESYTARGEEPGPWSIRRPSDGGEEWLYVLADGGLMFGRGVELSNFIPWDTDAETAAARLVEAEVAAGY